MFQTALEFIIQHQVVAGAVGALVVSAAVRALPDPAPNGNLFYLWLYRFSHAILANWDKVGNGSSKDQGSVVTPKP